MSCMALAIADFRFQLFWLTPSSSNWELSIWKPFPFC
jgi:hypothetical protein